jgi:hypothetical protein
MRIGEDLDSTVVAISNQQMASVRLKTQACWALDRTKSLALLAKGVEVGQGGSMKPLQTMTVVIRQRQSSLHDVDHRRWSEDCRIDQLLFLSCLHACPREISSHPLDDTLMIGTSDINMM